MRRIFAVGGGLLVAVVGWFLAMLLTANLAGAAFASVSGDAIQIAPPPSTDFDVLESNDHGFAFDEQQDVTLLADMGVDITQPGTYADDPGVYTPGVIPAGTVVSSQLIHFDPVGREDVFAEYDATLVTDDEIIGIIAFGTRLTDTDFLGAPGTVYPTGKPERGFEPFVNQQGDIIIEQVDRHTVNLFFKTKKHVDQVRIITRTVPDRVAPDVTSQVHNQAHQDITNQTVAAGTEVHDKAIVTGSGPTPTGTVDFVRFDNPDCFGFGVDVEENVPLGPDGTAESSTFTTVPGGMSYLVHYDGDATYLPGDGPCEPLFVEDVPGGGEGCTPGYWKQKQHFDSWTGFTPDQSFNTVFGRPAFPGKTLLQVLKQGGGGLNALGRHTVAALLNASSSGVDYDLTTAQVIQAFQQAFDTGDSSVIEGLKDDLEDFNEQGCPLN